MGLFDIFRSVSEYGFDQPITKRRPELQKLLDNGSFVADMVDQIDDMLKSRRKNEAVPEGYEGHMSLWIGYWGENTREGLVDYYEKFYELFSEYLGWDCYAYKHANPAKDFMEQCLVPILSDYYQQVGDGCVIMVRDRQSSKFTGGIFLVWTYPEF